MQVGEGKTEWIEIKKGVRQGSIIYTGLVPSVQPEGDGRRRGFEETENCLVENLHGTCAAKGLHINLKRGKTAMMG